MLTKYAKAAVLSLLSICIINNTLYAVPLSYTGGNLNLANGVIEQFEVTDLVTSDKANIYFDADLSGSQAANDTLTVSGTLSGQYNVGGVNILKEGLKNGTLTLFNGSIIPFLDNFNVYTTSAKYIFTAAGEAGKFDFALEQANLKDSITSADPVRNYVLQDTYKVSSALGAIGGTNSELAIIGHGNGIDGNTNNGITVTNGNTLYLAGVGALNEDGTVKSGYSNFQTYTVKGKSYASAINNAGTVIVENSIISGNKNIHKGDNDTSTSPTVYPYLYGGAVYNTGSLTLNNSYIANNRAQISSTNTGQSIWGGAVYNEGELNIDNSVFDNNSTYSSYRGVGSFGVSVANVGGAVEIKNSIFKNQNNISNSGNSALYSDTTKGGYLNIVNTRFQDNTSKVIPEGSGVSGTALYSSGILNVHNSVFNNNIADTRDFTGAYSVGVTGGAVNVYSGTAKFINTLFTNNFGYLATTKKPNNSTGNGAAMFSQGTVYLHGDGGDTIFRGNKIGKDGALTNVAIEQRGNSNSASHLQFYFDASNGGKVILDDQMVMTSYLDLNFNKNTFDANTTDTPRWAPKGGEIQINEAITTTSLSDRMYNIYGGVVSTGSSEQSAADGTPVTAPDLNLGSGYMLNMQGGILSFANNSIASKIAMAYIISEENAQLHIDADFANAANDTIVFSSTLGKGKMNLTGLNIISDGNISQMTLIKHNYNSYVYTPDFNSLNAYSNGYKYAITPSATKGLFNVAQSAVSGSDGIYAAIADTVAFRSYSTQKDLVLDTALGNANGPKDSLLTMLLNKHNIDGNSQAGMTIGANQSVNIFDAGNIKAEAPAGFNNFSGAVIENDGVATIYHSAFTNNSDTAVINKNYLTVSDGIFKKNTTTDNGGAVRNTDKAYLFNSVFESNTADNGGALYNTGDMTIVNSSFLNNSATAEGGAIYTEGAVTLNANAKDIKFSGNMANSVSNAVTIGQNGALNLNAAEGSSIIFDDTVLAKNDTATISINKDLLSGLQANGTVYANNKFGGNNAKVDIYSGALKLAEEGYLDNNNLSLKGGALDLRNGKTGVLNLSSFDSVEKSKLYIDISDTESDTINTASASGTVTIGGLNILKDITSATYNIFTNAAAQIKGMRAFTNSSVYEVSAGTQNGSIDVKNLGASAFDGFSAAVEDTTDVRSFSAIDDVFLAKDLPALGGQNTEFTVFGNGKSINGNTNKGLNITGTQEMNIFDSGKIENGIITAGINGFKGQDEGGFINNAGKVSISGSALHTNSVEGANAAGGALANSGNMAIDNSIFSANSAKGTTSAHGGAIATNGELNISNTSFFNNAVTADNANAALGGAIYIADGNKVNITANGGNVIFSGNKANGAANAIHLAGTSSVLNLNAYSALGKSAVQNGIVFDDAITSENIANQININKAEGTNTPDGSVYLNNSISNATVNLFGGNLILASDNLLDGTNFNSDGGFINLRNGVVGTAKFKDLNLSGDTKLGIDANLQDETTDFISAEGTVSGNGKLVISNINIIKDTNKETSILPAVSDNLKDRVELSSNVALSPIYKYDVAYDALTGALTFASQGTNANNYNPVALVSPIASQVGSYLAQLRAYESALGNVGMYTDDFPKAKDREFWFKPYGDFGDVELKDGPTVDNSAYGALIGVDTYAREMLFGLSGYYSIYAGYTGSTQKYEGIKNEQNGGIGGISLTMYGQRFFAGLALTAGYSSNKAIVPGGSDTFTTLTAGAALKTGYNIELPFYSLVLQPSVLTSYTMIDAEDYTSAANLAIKSDVLGVFQAAPALKLTAELPKGWRPALEAQMVWSFFDKSKYTADNVALADISVDPYFEYGINIQKIWSKDLSTYLKAMMRTQGIDGQSIQLGLKLAL